MYASFLDPPLEGRGEEIGFDGAFELSLANKVSDQVMDCCCGYCVGESISDSMTYGLKREAEVEG